LSGVPVGPRGPCNHVHRLSEIEGSKFQQTSRHHAPRGSSQIGNSSPKAKPLAFYAADLEFELYPIK